MFFVGIIGSFLPYLMLVGCVLAFAFHVKLSDAVSVDSQPDSTHELCMSAFQQEDTSQLLQTSSYYYGQQAEQAPDLIEEPALQISLVCSQVCSLVDNYQAIPSPSFSGLSPPVA